MSVQFTHPPAPYRLKTDLDSETIHSDFNQPLNSTSLCPISDLSCLLFFLGAVTAVVVTGFNAPLLFYRTELYIPKLLTIDHYLSQHFYSMHFPLHKDNMHVTQSL